MQGLYTGLFNEAVEGNEYLQMAIDIIRENSKGDIYVIGGFIYRNIANLLYPNVSLTTDIDFVVTGPINKDLRIPSGCEVKVNSYGCPKFIIKDGYTVDISSLVNRKSLVSRGMDQNIYNLLTVIPLGIQSIVYDLRSRVVMGEIGMTAIDQKIVKVLDRVQALGYGIRKTKCINRIIMEKASSLGFTPVID